ncbi:MAG: DUF4437 domain-containing protein [Lysobacterales bacterium]|jgi:quercetin dioxygenase-like cupin family protein
MTEKSITAYGDLDFAPLGEGSPAQAALLWGDPATGPAALLVRFPEGYSEPWHAHSATYRAVLVKGEFQSRARDATDSETVYGPGAFMVQPGGVEHSEVNAGRGDLLALVYFEGPVDFVMS